MRKILFVLTLAAMSWNLNAADGIDGKWNASFDSQVGTQTYTYEFKADGAQLTGTASSTNGSYAIVDGSIDGNKIGFVENMDYQGMALKITYTGELAGDELHLKRDVGGQGGEEFTAQRAQ